MTDQSAKNQETIAPSLLARAWVRYSESLSYSLAGAAYIALGFFAKQVFAWWSYGALFALLTLWALPAAWKRVRQ